MDRPSHGHHATPIAVKVTGVTPWIHHTRVKMAAASCDENTWKAIQDPKNLLKVWFQRWWLSPTKDAETRSSYSGSWLVNARRKLEDSSALLQPHSGSWSTHGVRIWLLKYRWIFIANPGLYPWSVLLLCSSLQDQLNSWLRWFYRIGGGWTYWQLKREDSASS